MRPLKGFEKSDKVCHVLKDHLGCWMGVRLWRTNAKAGRLVSRILVTRQDKNVA